MKPKTTNSKSRKPLIVSVSPRTAPDRPFPRVMWADYDPSYGKNERVAIYPTKSEQRGNRPDLKPIRVLVVALERNDQAPIVEALETLKRCSVTVH